MKKSSIVAIVVVILIIGIVILGMLVFDIGRSQPVSNESTTTPSESGLKVSTSTVASSSIQESLPEVSTTTDRDIIITNPKASSTITSPLVITGKALGSWFFEAQFPITIINSAGTIVAQGTAHAQGDWMTTDYVPFTATLRFATSSTATGTIQFKNDNPSGDPGRDKSVIIPISFSH